MDRATVAESILNFPVGIGTFFDQDAKLEMTFLEFSRFSYLTPLRTRVGPWQNRTAERSVGTTRREPLDVLSRHRISIFGGLGPYLA